MFARIATAALVALLPGLAAAQEEARPDAQEDARSLFEAMELPAIIDVMSREGLAYGEELGLTLFPAGEVPEAWTAGVAEIYEPARIEAEAFASFSAALEGEDLAAIAAFVEGEVGSEMAALELAAREAMLDEDVEQAAKEAAAVAVADGGPRLELIRRYAEANDIIDTNVAGAMNANLAYFMGLMDGGAADAGLSVGDVLADVQSQEPQIRADTTEWVYSFLLMAYGPASDEDLEALIAFSGTEGGQALNRAVFEAFDGVFEDISRDLGLASARYMTTQEL